MIYIFRDIILQGLTILAPVDSPNTDGIDPGNVRIGVRLYLPHCRIPDYGLESVDSFHRTSKRGQRTLD